MPRREGPLIGHTVCPECQHPNAEVRADRSGNPYRICTACDPDQATVYLTRGSRRKADRLLARTRRSSMLAASP